MYQLSRSKRDVQRFFAETPKQREVPEYQPVTKELSSSPIIENPVVDETLKEDSLPVIKD